MTATLRDRLLDAAPTPLLRELVGRWPESMNEEERRVRCLALLEAMAATTEGRP